MSTITRPILGNRSYYQMQNELNHLVNKFSSKEELSRRDRDTLLSNPAFYEFLKNSPGVVAITDFQTKEYVFLSENFEEITGHKRAEFYESGFVKTISIFPPAHADIIIHKIFPTMFDFFQKSADAGIIEDVRVSYSTRFIRVDGTEGWCLHQMKVLHTDEDNKILFGLKMMFDITDIKKDETINLILAKRDAKGIFRNTNVLSFLCNNDPFDLSAREKEVLTMISQGMNSQEISSALFISKHTVYNHRKNMLKKMDVKTTGELLKKAMANGVI